MIWRTMLIKSLLTVLLCIPFSLISFKVQAQNSISEFLHSSRMQYEQFLGDSQNSGIIHFVMGNESADLDSIISSISYAYLLGQEDTSNQAELYIPLMNIYREEIALRKDILYLFHLFGISADDILFLDDNVPLNRLFEQKKLRLNLVDHNVLRPRQEHLSDAIERIVDHHVDENKDYPLITNENKLIAEVGSNATLIAEKIFASPQVAMSTEFAAILLAPILIDTSNLKSAEKTTYRDIVAAKELQNLASTLPHDFYQKLLAAKNDISGLTPTMLLSKDFKEYLDGDILYGISSLPSEVEWNLEDLELVGKNIQKYAYERNLTYLILLMFSNDPQSKRKILVYSPSIDLLRAFDAYAQTDETLKNILIPSSFSETFQACFYRTEKFIARKQLQPLLDFSNNLEIKNH